MNWFDGIRSLETARERYRELLQQYHPDHGGDTDVCRQIIDEFEKFCQAYMNGKFDQYTADTGKQTWGADVSVFGHKLHEICKLNVTIEIIGFWIYVTDCWDVKDQLSNMDLWWSRKHKAWVYNGGRKRQVKTKFTTDDIRALHGSTKIKDREEQEKVT